MEVRNLLTVHTLKTRLPESGKRWWEMERLIEPVQQTGSWKDILSQEWLVRKWDDTIQINCPATDPIRRY